MTDIPSQENSTPNQTDALLFLEEHPTWYTVKEVQKAIGSKSDIVCVGKFLKQLHKYDFVDRKKMEKRKSGNEYVYRIKGVKDE